MPDATCAHETEVSSGVKTDEESFLPCFAMPSRKHLNWKLLCRRSMEPRAWQTTVLINDACQVTDTMTDRPQAVPSAIRHHSTIDVII